EVRHGRVLGDLAAGGVEGVDLHHVATGDGRDRLDRAVPGQMELVAANVHRWLRRIHGRDVNADAQSAGARIRAMEPEEAESVYDEVADAYRDWWGPIIAPASVKVLDEVS